MEKIKSILSKIIISAFIFATIGMNLAMGGSMLHTNRSFEAQMGWLKIPNKDLSLTYKKIFLTKVNAGAVGGAVFCTNCVNEATFQAENILNKLLRSFVMTFIQGIINFLKSAFENLLNMIEDWASTAFGLRLNLCNVKRHVALQSVLLYNAAEGTINNLFGNTTEALNNEPETKLTMENAIAKAGTTIDNAAAIEAADSQYPACASNNPVPRADEIIDSVSSSMQELNETKEKIAETATFSGDPIAGVVGQNLIKFSPNAADTAALVSSLKQRSEDVKVEASGAMDALDKQSPPECAMAQVLTPSENNSGGSWNQGGINANLSAPHLQDQARVTGALEARVLNRNECETTDVVGNSQTALQTTAASQSAPEGDLLDSIMNIVMDFFNQIFERLKAIITEVIRKVVNEVTQFIDNIAFSLPSSIFGDLTNSVLDVSDTIRDLERALRQEIRDTNLSDIIN